MFAALLLALPAHALTPQDAIKAQAGCYAVTFSYVDTQVFHADYPRRPPHSTEAVEWISVEIDEHNHIQLQHVLVTGPAMIRHWTQDWRLEGRDVVSYAGDDTWIRETLPEDAVAGRWVQRVDNVDGGPRYACSAAWSFGTAAASWTCTVDAPLPRREKRMASVYDLLERQNTHEIHADGWRHIQHNAKVRFEDGGRVEVAREYGNNTYDRIDDAACAEAITWWPTQRVAWQGIQQAWEGALAPHAVVHIDDRRRGLPLWVRLFLVAKRASKAGLTADAARAQAEVVIQKHVDGANMDAISGGVR